MRESRLGRLNYRMQKAVLALTAVLMLSTIVRGGVAAAGPRDDEAHARFRSESAGLPFGTEVGAWLVDTNKASLILAGGSPIGHDTLFRGTWTSAPIQPEHLTSLDATMMLATVDEFGRPVGVTTLTRVREVGDRWGQWERAHFRIGPGEDLRKRAVRLAYARRRSGTMQVQWRIVGHLGPTASLSGRVDLEAQ